MTFEEEYEAWLKRQNTKLIIHLVFWILVTVGIIGCIYLSITNVDTQEPRTIGLGTIAVDKVAVQKMLDDLDRNLTIHIAGNYTGNVTVWKGDKVVCFFPSEPISLAVGGA